MEFVVILFSHLLGDYIFQPSWIYERKPKNLFVLLLHLIIYSVTMYITLPILILILQIFSGMPMSIFLTSYELTSVNGWNIDILIYIFLGHLLVDIWTHRLSYIFENRYMETEDKKWKNLSFYMNGVDQFLHILHIYLIYNIIFG